MKTRAERIVTVILILLGFIGVAVSANFPEVNAKRNVVSKKHDGAPDPSKKAFKK